jgi:transposase
MPPLVTGWVAEDHLAWTVLEAVGELGLSVFYADYRADGHGRPAYEPSMMVALLMFAHARGNRSARGIERACVEDVACRVVAGNSRAGSLDDRGVPLAPRAGVGRGVLRGARAVCARAGLVSVGVVAIDGTRMSADASINANRDFGQIAREVLAEAAETDRREDEPCGRERGDELPGHLRAREGRRRAPREAEEPLERERGQAAEPAEDAGDEVAVDLDPRRFVARPRGRRAWVRGGRRALDAKREREARPIAHDRTDRLFEACRRLEEELVFEDASHRAHEARRARGIAADGSRRMAPGMIKPTSRRWRRAGWSTRPITIRGSCAPMASRRCRATTPRRPSTTSRSSWPPRSRPSRRTSGTWNRWSVPSNASCARSTWAIPPSSWPTPGTGISARWNRSSATA